MNTRFKLALAMIAGTALGAAGMQGLHAQASKLRAYGVTELEIIDKTAQASYIPAVRKAMASAHGRALETLGRVVPIEGAPPRRLSASPRGTAWTTPSPSTNRKPMTI